MMGDLNAEIEEHILKVDKTVADSIRNLSDIDFDNYNTDGCNGYGFFGNHRIFRSRIAVKYYCYGNDSHEEVTLIKNLDHKNVLHVWDAHTVGNGWAFFITDEMTNGTLDSFMSANSISTDNAMDVVRGLLSGVGKMHEVPNCLLHRDLKPANILIDSIGNPVIADFGSIKRLPQSEKKVKASQHSPLYRPPESFDDGYYMIPSDIYQLGLTMYQVLGGNLPYDPCEYMNGSQLKVYMNFNDDYDKSKYVDNLLHDKATKGKLITIPSLPYYTDHKLIHIIRKATNPDPDKRYQNAADFLLDLHRVGSIPNWTRQNGDVAVCEYKSSYFRIINTKKGFTLEKSKDGVTWRKAAGIGYEMSEVALYKKAF